MKQRKETIRQLAVLPTFLYFSVLDTLVQPVDCSNLCQVVRVPRRQSVSEGSYETGISTFLSAMMCLHYLWWEGWWREALSHWYPWRSLSQYWANHQNGEMGDASPLCLLLQMISELTYTYQISFCLSAETFLKKSLNPSIFFIVLYHICGKQKHCVLPH